MFPQLDVNPDMCMLIIKRGCLITEQHLYIAGLKEHEDVETYKTSDEQRSGPNGFRNLLAGGPPVKGVLYLVHRMSGKLS